MPHDIVILYGSQTGNAEDVSKRIGLQAKRLGYQILVQTMDDFPIKTLPQQNVVLFVCSTTGFGQEPENMKSFYNFIRRRDLPNTCLSSLRYAVYGLGDSSFAKFNYVSKILHKRLKECGASPIQDLAIADEQHPLGCDGVFEPQLEDLWLKLEGLLHPKPEEKSSPLCDSSYLVQVYRPQDIPTSRDIFKTEFIEKYNLKTAYCTRNERVTPVDHFQETRFLNFTTTDLLDYSPGDVCAIMPSNSNEDTSMFINSLKLDPNNLIKIEKRDTNYMVNYLYDFLPNGLSVYNLVKHFLDINSVPRRSFFQFLWPFSGNDMEREKLKELASFEGQEDMFDYCVLPKRSILEVLLDFPHTVKNIKFEYLFDLIPPMKPRSFSIASSVQAHPGEVHLIVGIVRYQTRMKKVRKGLCSNYLASLSPTEGFDPEDKSKCLRFFIKRTSFKLPSPITPIIMIGPGLGISPFRSFIEALAVANPNSSENFLFFGCRFKDADFYFQDELERYANDGVISLRVAFSRENHKTYVQDLILEESLRIKELITSKNATIYVAGNSKLPEDIRKQLGSLLVSENGDTSIRNSEKVIAQLEVLNKIQYDCW